MNLAEDIKRKNLGSNPTRKDLLSVTGSSVPFVNIK